MQIAIPELTVLFVLGFARVGTLVMLLPGLGELPVPGRVRLALALFLTVLLLPLVRPLLPGLATPGGIVGCLMGEIAVGFVLGLSARAVFAALATAGAVVAQQVGFTYASTVNPAFGGQDTSVSQFLGLLGMTLVFATDLHHVALAAIGDSYALLPPVGVPDPGDAADLALRSVVRGFSLGVRISAPFIVFAILFNLGLGILSRMMPQMQVFFLGLPATIFAGFLILVVSLGLMMSTFLGDLGGFLRDLGRP